MGRLAGLLKNLGFLNGSDSQTTRPNRWRTASDGRWLTGELVKLSDGSVRMSVDGYVTSRELYEVHGLTPALIKKFLSEHDEKVVFGNGGSCLLYSTDRIRALLQSREYLVEREKTEQRRETGRRSAAKRAATLARKRELEDKAEAEARAEFGGGIYLVRCVYDYGWREYCVYARDIDHARALMVKWLRSEEGRNESTELHEDAVDEYQSEIEDYRELKRDAIPGEKLRKPERPKKGEFKLTIEAVTDSELDSADYEMEEVRYEDEGGGWSHDVFADSEEHKDPEEV